LKFVEYSSDCLYRRRRVSKKNISAEDYSSILSLYHQTKSIDNFQDDFRVLEQTRYQHP
jgi:hypothetical protein